MGVALPPKRLMVFSLVRFQGHTKSEQQTYILVVELAGDPIPDTTPTPHPGSFHFPRQRRDCKLALAASSFRNRSAWGSRRNLRRCFTAIKSIWHGVSDRTAGQTQKAPDPSECPGLSSPRDGEGRIPCDPIAVCGKPHVRRCGRVPGRNPQHPTRSPDSQRLANASFPGFITEKLLTAASLEC